MADPSDRNQLERFLRDEESREREEEYLPRYHRHIAGGHFVAIGAFAASVFVGYLDHEPLTFYWPQAAVLWHPAVITTVFAVCFLGYLGWRSWYANNRPAPDVAPGPGVRLGFWLPLGLALGGLVLLGALSGLTACAAGLAVAAWLIAHRRTGGALLLLHAHRHAEVALWRRIVRRCVAAPLLPSSLVASSVVPPAIGFPAPNLFAVFALGVLGGTLFAIGCVSAVEYHRYVLKERNTREGSA